MADTVPNQSEGRVVYVLTSGSYSDYGIVGIFSTKENAEEFKLRVKDHDYNDIAEMELDAMLPQLRAGMIPWSILMLRDGSLERPVEPCAVDRFNVDRSLGIWRRTQAPAYKGKGIPDALWGNVMALSAKHAVKIASEKRAQLIASGEWK